MSCTAVTPAQLTTVPAGAMLVTNGNNVVAVPDAVAAAFQPGDKIFAIERPTNSRAPAPVVDVLHIPAATTTKVTAAVTRACDAFHALKNNSDADITNFFLAFAAKLADDAVWGVVAAANAADVAAAQAKGRSTTRLRVSDTMRASMIAGLRVWAAMPSPRQEVVEAVEHTGWRCETVKRELGPVAFVFEGRPNVLADGAGVLRAGNTAVLRIGSDAVGTATALFATCITPALQAAMLPDGALVMVDNPTHADSWALFGDQRLRLAVARGSGRTVDLLGSIAQASGVNVSLHGTGGAWAILTETAATMTGKITALVAASLDRKVCNTLNTICIPASIAAAVLPSVLAGLEAAGAKLNTTFKIHAHASVVALLPVELLTAEGDIIRASGTCREPRVETFTDFATLGREWEWEGTPEVAVVLVKDVAEAVAHFNDHSPQFVAVVWGTDEAERQKCFISLNAPFVGDGFTRWVDGQKALSKPELGLSSWEQGRFLGRGGILTGDAITSRVLRHVTTTK